VLFLVFGSSAAGKTSALNELRDRVPNLAVHDFDEIEPPAGADLGWRHRATEQWVRRALDYQAAGKDLLLAGQTPFGELLAAPSAPLLEAISACLIDCDDATRTARLQARGVEWFARTAGDHRSDHTWPEWIQRHVNWGEWMRRHASDPTWRTDVIRNEAADSEMNWSRWSDWKADDPRWRVHVIDTSVLPVAEVGERLARWIDEERALFRQDAHPLVDWS